MGLFKGAQGATAGSQQERLVFVGFEFFKLGGLGIAGCCHAVRAV